MDTIERANGLTLLPMYLENCPTRQVLDRIGDKWSVLVMGLLLGRTMRFSQLKRDIMGISQKMLTQTLRGLERDGLISRTLYAEVPPRVEYALTPLGQSLGGLITALQQWADQNIESVMTAQTIYDKINRPAEATVTE
jgi:DNA-binding HxlR family transcriptional regulator